MMKTVLLFAMAVLVSTVTFSQVRIGGQVHGSLNAGYFEVKQQVSLSQQSKGGFGAGIVSEVTLSERLSLRPSLNFSKKGIKLTAGADNPEGEGSVKAEMDANLSYIELPVVFAYNLPIGDNKAFIGIGPSVGFGIAGKSKMSYSLLVPGLPPMSESEKITSFKKDADGGAGFKRFDAGATLVAGMQFSNGLFVNASGNYGLTNNFENDEESGKYQSRSVQLTVGFFLK
jgi:hypothetical protein